MGFGKGKGGQDALDYLGKEREPWKTICVPALTPCDVWLAIESMGNYFYRWGFLVKEWACSCLLLRPMLYIGRVDPSE